jgi:mono/diheme cytochrome c family protein
MRRRHLLPALLAVASTALLVAGCGGSDSGGGSGAQSSTDGKALFKGKCGSCHTLAAAGTSGTFGPNLDDLKPVKDRVLAAIAAGPGPMPNNLYEGAEAETVATFVSESAGK